MGARKKQEINNGVKKSENDKKTNTSNGNMFLYQSGLRPGMSIRF